MQLRTFSVRPNLDWHPAASTLVQHSWRAIAVIYTTINRPGEQWFRKLVFQQDAIRVRETGNISNENVLECGDGIQLEGQRCAQWSRFDNRNFTN